MVKNILYGFCFSLTQLTLACGNDLQPADNPLRREFAAASDSVQGDHDAGSAAMKAAAAATTGLFLRIENAIKRTVGARKMPTGCHVDVRLCGFKEQVTTIIGESSHTQRVTGNCRSLIGTVNQGEAETFYLSSDEAQWLLGSPRVSTRLRLNYRLTCQASSVWYRGGETDLHPDIDRGKQVLEVKVVEARLADYRDEIATRFYPEERD